MNKPGRPLEGIRVIEFGHMVMGPTCGLILADLGAEVIKVEPAPNGDNTRRLPGSGAGYFGAYNRNKKSVSINLKSSIGLEFATKLVASADVLVENFGPGVLDQLGLGFETLKHVNPRLVYCALKGFLTGPYEHRAALDEVAQMMGGLAYMTGPTGQPLRAGASVNDIMAGLFGVIAVQAALWERRQTGAGKFIRSGLFENNLFLVAQHMVQFMQTGVPAVPMPERTAAWAVYDVFETGDKKKIFIGVVSDKQWSSFCSAFDLNDLANDQSLNTNAKRVAKRNTFLPRLRNILKTRSLDELASLLEDIGLPFAPIVRPDELIDDPHVNHPGATVNVTLDNGSIAKVPSLPFEYDGVRPDLYLDLPKVGEHSEALAIEMGYTAEALEALRLELGQESNEP